jgi:hypothetical protein
MEKLRKLSKEDLETEHRKSKGRRGVQKHFILRHDLDHLVTEYARKLGVSQAQVIEEMMLIGVSKFEINHGFRVGEKSDGQRIGDLTEQLNEKVELILEQKRRETAKKSNSLTEAYSRWLAHGNSDDWQTQGYG